jgi:murein DD-endopeptidase MepM/ murein hydrolase activator NlpD
MFLIAAGCSFWGLLKIQGLFFHNEEIKRLAKENQAFAAQRALLVSEIEALENQTAELKTTESDVYRRLYLTNLPSETGSFAPLEEKNLSDFTSDDFRTLIQKTSTTLDRTMQTLTDNHAGFSGLFWPTKSDVGELQQYPTISPIQKLEPGMVASGFGNRINPFNKKIYRHTGLDLIAEKGTQVVSTANGRIIQVHFDQTPGGSGSYILIDHGKGYQTRYSKLESVLLRPGQSVRQGQIIGTVGQTGTSIAPHLHYEIFLNGKPVDPVSYMVESFSFEDLEFIRKRAQEMSQSLD